MDGHPKPSRPLYIELRFTDCAHVLRGGGWELVHGSDCSKHSYICMPTAERTPLSFRVFEERLARKLRVLLPKKLLGIVTLVLNSTQHSGDFKRLILQGQLLH